MIVGFNFKKIYFSLPIPKCIFYKYIYPKRQKWYEDFMNSIEVQEKISELSKDLTQEWDNHFKDPEGWIIPKIESEEKNETDLLSEALKSDDKVGKGLIPQNFLEGSGFKAEEDGSISQKITKDDLVFWKNIKK